MNRPITLDNLDQRVTFRFADANDVPELLLRYEDSTRKRSTRTCSNGTAHRARETILNGIVTDTRPHIVADGRTTASSGFSPTSSTTRSRVRPCMVLMEFYVAPEHRRSAIGRALLGDGDPGRQSRRRGRVPRAGRLGHGRRALAVQHVRQGRLQAVRLHHAAEGSEMGGKGATGPSRQPATRPAADAAGARRRRRKPSATPD